ncbi:MAG: DUF4156 domain-containing protein [Betaproteobacteria bacterium]
MRYFKKMLVVAAVPLFALLSGCASDFIKVREGSDRVSLAEASQVGNCQSLGRTTVSVVTKVGLYNRSIEDVDANLLQMARNSAVDMGGDTVVRGDRLEVGKRVFAIYKCRP